MSDDHPLCAPACSIQEQATRLAQLHSRLRAGTAAEAASISLPQGSSYNGLEAALNHQGTLVIVQQPRLPYFQDGSLFSCS